MFHIIYLCWFIFKLTFDPLVVNNNNIDITFKINFIS